MSAHMSNEVVASTLAEAHQFLNKAQIRIDHLIAQRRDFDAQPLDEDQELLGRQVARQVREVTGVLQKIIDIQSEKPVD